MTTNLRTVRIESIRRILAEHAANAEVVAEYQHLIQQQEILTEEVYGVVRQLVARQFNSPEAHSELDRLIRTTIRETVNRSAYTSVDDLTHQVYMSLARNSRMGVIRRIDEAVLQAQVRETQTSQGQEALKQLAAKEFNGELINPLRETVTEADFVKAIENQLTKQGFSYEEIEQFINVVETRLVVNRVMGSAATPEELEFEAVDIVTEALGGRLLDTEDAEIALFETVDAFRQTHIDNNQGLELLHQVAVKSGITREQVITFIQNHPSFVRETISQVFTVSDQQFLTAISGDGAPQWSQLTQFMMPSGGGLPVSLGSFSQMAGQILQINNTIQLLGGQPFLTAEAAQTLGTLANPLGAAVSSATGATGGISGALGSVGTAVTNLLGAGGAGTTTTVGAISSGSSGLLASFGTWITGLFGTASAGTAAGGTGLVAVLSGTVEIWGPIMVIIGIVAIGVMVFIGLISVLSLGNPNGPAFNSAAIGQGGYSSTVAGSGGTGVGFCDPTTNPDCTPTFCTGNCACPVHGPITQGPGGKWSHTAKNGAAVNAIDIGIPDGTPVFSISTGTVTYAQFSPSGYGNLVVVTAADGTSMMYGHLDSYFVTEGQQVQAGKQIGTSDNTGNSTGSHLHLEYKGPGVQNILNLFNFTDAQKAILNGCSDTTSCGNLSCSQ